MPTKSLTIPLTTTAATNQTSALLNLPTTTPQKEHLILLAHGAGLGMTSPFMEAIATTLAARGFIVMRFNYAYQELITKTGRKRPPEKKQVLVETHLAAYNTLAALYPGRPMLFAGKSMGSRMGSYLAETGVACAGLVMFGYPLHPQGKNWKLRQDQFPNLDLPALFLTGTRDKLAELPLLEKALQTYAGQAKLDIVEGADHDFKTLVAQKLSPEQVREELVDRLVSWLETST
jgi:predicted alpha/beta-hydrolase family hydrolase